MLREHRLALWTAAALAALAAAAVAARLAARNGDRLRRGESIWRLGYEVELHEPPPGARIRVALPADTRYCRVLRESFTQSGLALDVVRTKTTGRREAAAVPFGRPRRARLRAEFDLRVSREPHRVPPAPRERLPVTRREYFLRNEAGVQVRSDVVAATLAELLPGRAGAAQRVAAIFEHCSHAVAADPDEQTDDAESVLQQGIGSPLGRARAMLALCRAAKIPARLAAGFVLDADGDAAPHPWVEARLDRRWVPFDPERGYANELPPGTVPVRQDGFDVVRASIGVEANARFVLSRIPTGPFFAGRSTGRLADVIDLARLSVGMQQTLAVLLLLPLGALITALFRNVIGFQTFGTFTPTLLALSFVYADWRTGLIVLAVVAAAGLVGRSFLERLRLLMVPRLSLILTLVVVALTLAVSVLDHFGLTPSARAVILPLVIVTMMVERFHVTAEESGLRRALQLLGATLLVSACCFAVLRWEALGRLAVAFPEGVLFVAAALVLVGRYSGYRVTELWRFRDV
jgi:transglutaminase-like putative cysteine protease